MSHSMLALVVDDEPDICNLLSLTLKKMGINALTAHTVTDAKRILNRDAIDFCISDMKLPDESGLDLLTFVRKQFPAMPFAMITAFGNMDIAVNALKNGAFDFISKPVELPRLRQLVNQAIELSKQHVGTLQSEELDDYLIGESDPIQNLKNQIAKLANSQAPVHIYGESGTGKERVAKLMHKLSDRREAPFIAVNCGAIPSELMESEFFGHKKGSFTGAVNDKKGFFQAANGGTLFLDEIAELSLSMQVKLLRAIQEKSVRPVGQEEEIPVNIRVLSATHNNLHDLVNQNRFRQDLFYRINVIQLDVPPLRERFSDLKLITHYILANISEEIGRPSLKITQEAINLLQTHYFPGNIRELENVLYRAVALCDSDEIRDKDITIQNGKSIDSNIQEQLEPTLEHVVNNTNKENIDIVKNSQVDDLALTPNFSIDHYIEQLERQLIENALKNSNGNRTQAADQLGISFRSIRYKIKKLEIDV